MADDKNSNNIYDNEYNGINRIMDGRKKTPNNGSSVNYSPVRGTRYSSSYDGINGNNSISQNRPARNAAEHSDYNLNTFKTNGYDNYYLKHKADSVNKSVDNDKSDEDIIIKKSQKNADNHRESVVQNKPKENNRKKSQPTPNKILNKDTGKPPKEEDVGGSIVISIVRAVIYLAVVTVIAAVISIFVINVANDVFAFVKSDDIVEVTIPENASKDDIAEVLYQNGIIKYKNIFKFYGNYKKIDDNFVAGDYSVTPMMNYQNLYAEFREKPVSGTSWITIPEGYTVDEFIDLMVSNGIGTKEKYIDVINNYDFDYWFIDELEETGWSQDRYYRLEGYLFPDTYEFYNASSEVTVINKMLKRFSEIYTDALKQRAVELGMSTDKVVILASMIEKEAGQPADYRNISSVFYNRINNSDRYSRFDSDATVVYAIQHDTGERPKEVTDQTLEYASPYNTYQNNGFPPGAIANPGMNAIKYALYPADTGYYYFVSNGNETLFASTYQEHQNNIASIK